MSFESKSDNVNNFVEQNLTLKVSEVPLAKIQRTILQLLFDARKSVTESTITNCYRKGFLQK